MNYACYIFVYLEKERNFLFLEKKKKGILCFLGRQGVCSRSYVSPGAMKKSDLRSSLGRKKLVCWVDFIFFFQRFVLIA